ncbi:MAG: oxidoreductase [Pseudonocardiaceae bacterium]|nr:MAG: oxidoreductase [Pseudonocardiaceae bacterium]
MTDTRTAPGGTLALTPDLVLSRVGYGAMQLAGPGVMGPPRDKDTAVAVLRAAVELGVTHLDTSDFYGPVTVNELIREALHPYPADLRIVTKVGFRRGPGGSWDPAASRDELVTAVHDNLRHLGVDALDVMNLRIAGDDRAPVADRLGVLAELREQGLVRHLGLSNVSVEQVAQAREVTPIVCVQNMYNLVHRGDDALVDLCADAGIAYVPFFPLGGFSPLQAGVLDDVAARVGASAQQVALAWLLQRSPTILLIPGTSSPVHLRENLAAADVVLSDDDRRALDAIAAG